MAPETDKEVGMARSRKVLRLVSLVGVVAALAVGTAVPASANDGAVQSNWATVVPNIDGVFSPGEWDDAAVVDLGAVPGNNFTAYWYIKNDARDSWPIHVEDGCNCPESLGELTLAQSPTAPPSPVPGVPTISLWGTLAMTVALAGLVAWKLRRGTAGSST